MNLPTRLFYLLQQADVVCLFVAAGYRC